MTRNYESRLTRWLCSSFKVHQAVIDAGEEESGCTIHEVTETVDGGPIVVQKRVKVSLQGQHHVLQ
jgi:phosphoribosylglycinamide formyltransferase-1